MSVVPIPQLTRPVRVVVVDDTEDLRDLLRMALTRGGLEVVGQAGDGLEGIETVQREKPDVVLLDLSMPVMDGLTALPRIRAVAPRAKIIILSGFEAGRMAEEAMALGADGYLQKGMALGRILDYVRELVAQEVPEPAPSVLPSPPGPALTVLRRPEPDDTGRDGAGAAEAERVPADPAVELAPFGVLEVNDDPAMVVVRTNPEARRLLAGRAVADTPLSTLSPELATSVAYHRLEPDRTFEVELHGDVVLATVRRSAGSLLVYLAASGHAVSRLRRAIATTAHEIRGPVTVLGGIAETLEQHGDQIDAAHRTRLLASVARQARMLDGITNDLLTAAQVTRRTLRLRTTAVDPGTIVDSVIAHRSGVAVERTDLRPVQADPLKLEQMVANLVGNAEKYGRSPITVAISPHPTAPDQVCISVGDSGDGVPPDFRTDLFQEFSRAAGTTVSGTGLGLYVVRTLAEAQGGSIEHHAPVTGGAVFTISMPAARE